ncbi:transposase [Bartonella tamiae]|uniref:transposase n=1 Tax=Bartonella tamiae TaxID=373638 RepID=UPI002475E6DF|nr:transposase [Bartonella tamiae]
MDAEWQIVLPFLERQHKVGRPRKHSYRAIWNAILYLTSTGCQWDQLPKDFPPFRTVQYYFYRLRDSGLLDVIHESLIAFIRQIEGRAAQPTARLPQLDVLFTSLPTGSSAETLARVPKNVNLFDKG